MKKGLVVIGSILLIIIIVVCINIYVTTMTTNNNERDVTDTHVNTQVDTTNSANNANEDGDYSTVYFTSDISSTGLMNIYNMLDFTPQGNTAIKLSTGKRFTDNFADFIKKYNFTDMYTSSFYDFETEEEKWAYWAKHIYVNNTGMEATELYKKLFNLVKDKNYFVITTNVDDQFYKAGFDKDKIFATQGSYRYIQCGIACHNKLYDAKDLVAKMLEDTHNCKIPSELVPVCPVCGETMDVNIRKDAYFVEDEHWYKQDERYGEFLDTTKNNKVLLLELGVGFNTPGIIRISFEQMTYKNPNWKLVRINKDDCRTFLDIDDRSILIEDDISKIIDEIEV